MLGWITSVDFYILDFIRSHLNCAFLDATMSFSSALGNFGLIWILLTAVLFCLKKYRKTAAAMGLALIMTLLVCNCVLKPLIARTRPFNVNTAINLIIAAPKDYSFPSGHTSASFAAATALFAGDKKLGAFALALAAIIAFSRLYLYVHYPSDVLAGAVIGIVLVLAAVKITELLYQKRKSKV